MRPESHKSLKKQATVSYVRMLIKRDLYWLPGFPANLIGEKQQTTTPLNWCYFDGNRQLATMLVSRDSLRRAEMTFKRLTLQFAAALPEIIDDVKRWTDRIDSLICYCKRSVHEQQKFDVSDALIHSGLQRRWINSWQRLHQNHPTLRELLDVIGIYEWSATNEPSLSSLRWIDQHAVSLQQLVTADHLSRRERMIVLFSIWQSRNLFPKQLVNAICLILADEFAFKYPIDNPLLGIKRLIGKTKKLLRSRRRNWQSTVPFETAKQNNTGPVLGRQILNLLKLMLQRKPALRKPIFKLLTLFIDTEHASQIAEINKQICSLRNRLLRLSSQIRSAAKQSNQISAAFCEIQTNFDEFPKRVDQTVTIAVGLSQCVRQIIKNSSVQSDFDWHDALLHLPMGLRMKLFARWNEVVKYDRSAAKRLIFLLPMLSGLLRKHASSPLLLEHFDQTNPDFVSSLCSGSYGNESIRGTINLLDELCSRSDNSSVAPRMLNNAAIFLTTTFTTANAISMMQGLGDSEELPIGQATAKAAWYFSGSTTQACQLLKIIADDDEYLDHLSELMSFTADSHFRLAIGKLIELRQLSSVKKISWAIQILRYFDASAEFTDLQCTAEHNGDSRWIWIKEFSNEFRANLFQLAQTTSSAASIARRILSKDFPDRNKLAAELTALETRIKAEPPKTDEKLQRMKGRMRNIETYLKTRPGVSAQRAKNLNDKLESRWLFELTEKLVDQAQNVVRSEFSNSENVEAVAGQMSKPRYLQLLANILKLQPNTRELGLRLLFDAKSGTTKSFEQEPGNVRFIENLQQKGIDYKPWNDAECWELKTDSGQKYTLTFTDQVIDYLLMGLHFDTCLAPDSFNFFSTVSDAVDVNKRVLYGRTADGQVIGRCLLAINNRYQILVYHCYQHDSKSGFADAVGRYAEHLANAMGTDIACDGEVLNLVATEWYDDVAVDKDSSVFAVGGPIDQAIEKSAPDEKLSTLTQWVPYIRWPLRLNEILKIINRTQCPKFKTEVLSAFTNFSQLSVKQRLTLATFAWQDGMRILAFQFLRNIKQKLLIRFFTNLYPSEFDYELSGTVTLDAAFEMLNSYNPTLGLRVLRAYRPRNIAYDEQDQNQYRRLRLAEAHRQLGWHALADRLMKVN